MNTLAWLAEAGGIFGGAVTFIRTTLGLDPTALLFALLTPGLLLYGRHEVRLRRLRSIKDFLRVFGTNQESQADADPAPVQNPRRTTAGRAPARVRLTIIRPSNS